MVNAYIMCKVDPGTEATIRKQILNLENVGRVSVVYGDVDLVIEVEVKDLLELRELNDDIRRVEGVTRTATYLVKKES